MGWLPALHLGLKAFAAIWSLITFAVAAAFLAQVDSYFRGFYFSGQPTSSAGAVVAAGVLGFIYFSAVVFLMFAVPENVILSVMVDTIVISILFLIALGGTAAESVYASDFRNCGASFCDLGSGVIGVGWIYTLLLFGILLFEVIYTFVRHGGDLDTWKTPFNELLHRSTKHTGATQNRGIETSNVSSAPVTTSAV